MNGKRLLAAAVTLLIVVGVAPSDGYDDIVKYDWDQSRLPASTIEAEIRAAATPAAQRAIEAKLLKALANPAATRACKQFICRALRKTGSPACVPAMAKLLRDEKLSHMARFALRGLPGDEASAALRAALGEVKGKLKIGVISTLGERGDRKAVAALAPLVGDSDVDLARAAIAALGRIGCPGSAKVLAAAQVPDALETARADAYLLCADRMLAGGETAAACAIYRKMFAPGNAKSTRIAALRGIALAEKAKAAPTLVALMSGKDVDLRRAAGKYVIEMPGEEATLALSGRLASVSADAQVTLIDALAARGDKAASADVARLAGGRDERVRVAALKALGTLGDASSVPMLAKAASAGGEVGKAAANSLNTLKGEGVGEAMSKLLDSPDAAIRGGILNVLIVRADKEMAPVMIKAAGDKDAKIRQAAVKGIAATGGEKELPAIVSLLLACKDPAERSGLESALASSAGRVTDADAAAAPVAAGLARADADAKLRLVRVIGRIGGAKALAAMRGQLRSTSADVVTEVVRTLAAWPDAGAAADLLNIIKTTRSQIHKVLAFRGYVRMANLGSQRGSAETTKMYEQALQLATTAQEKKSVLSGLANAHSAKAMKLVEGLLSDASLKAEAELALVQIAGNVRGSAPDEAKAALKKIITDTTSSSLRKKARDILNEIDRFKGYITAWLGSGPYTKGDAFATAFGPEQKDAKNVKWKVLTKGVGPQIIDLLKAFGGENRAVYVKTNVYSSADQDVQLEMGSDDGVKAWVNGKLVHSNNASRAVAIGQDRAKARLKKGWNVVMLKIANGGADWGFCLRICKPDGTALDGLKVSIEDK